MLGAVFDGRFRKFNSHLRLRGERIPLRLCSTCLSYDRNGSPFTSADLPSHHICPALTIILTAAGNNEPSSLRTLEALCRYIR